MAETQTRATHQDRRDSAPPPAGASARRALLATLPIAERRLQLAGVSTAVLEGGSGPPVLLLHGPGGYAAHWMRMIPTLAATHRVIAPDLPGHGESEVDERRPLDAERILAWLDELIDQTCPSPPALVGELVGGAIAARFAIRHGRVNRLVLIDTFGLQPFTPTPAFGAALGAFVAGPTPDTLDRLWRQCAFDLDGLRRRMGGRWDAFAAYNVERARAPSVQAALQALMQTFGAQAIAPAELESIAVPTALIWGRHDLATPLAAAEVASARYGWPLHVIEDCNDAPPIEQPEAVLRVLLEVLDGSTTLQTKTRP